MLSLHKKKPDILHYVNLHDELPRGLKESRAEEGVGEADYDIPEMWRRLQQEEPDAIRDAVIFQHGEAGGSKNSPARRSVAECDARDTNPSGLTAEQGLGNNSPKYNYKQRREPGAGKGLGETSPRSCADFMTPEGSQHAASPDVRHAKRMRTMGLRPAPDLPTARRDSALGEHPELTSRNHPDLNIIVTSNT